MPTTITLLDRQVRQGAFRNLERAVPAAVTGFSLEMDRDTLTTDTGSDLARAEIQLSLDNGVTWPFGWTFAVRGGVVLDKQGAPLQVSSLKTQLPGVGSTTRRVRAHMEALAAIDVGLRVTVYP